MCVWLLLQNANYIILPVYTNIEMIGTYYDNGIIWNGSVVSFWIIFAIPLASRSYVYDMSKLHASCDYFFQLVDKMIDGFMKSSSEYKDC